MGNDLHPIQHEVDAMSPDTLKLYHSTASPNSRRVTLDFAKALELTAQPQHAALKRWYETISARPSAAA
jgi:glutathione S-transferase